jgi:hypothetical protein
MSEGLSPVMREVLAKAARVAREETSVVITGETGVGKEWLALWIHEHSRRAGQEFVPVSFRVNPHGTPCPGATASLPCPFQIDHLEFARLLVVRN